MKPTLNDKYEKYIGIPYAVKGRTEKGVDCWGLVRLVYANEFGIDLPSLAEDYNDDDVVKAELIALHKEGWERVEEPSDGDVILFKMLGYEAHVGVYVGDNTFLHCRENQDTVRESINNPIWKRRIVGAFRYKEYANAVTVPHPLKTQTYTIPVLVGTTIAKFVNDVQKQYKVAEELKPEIFVMINGVPVAKHLWETTKIKQGDLVGYRCLPKGKTFRTLAIIALAVFAPQIAGALTAGVAAATTAGASVFGSMSAAWAAGAVGSAFATLGVTVAGMALIDKIAPIRPPAEPTNPGQSEKQLMVSGAQNTAQPYGAIPVVLGRVRITPPIGAINKITFENERDTYLSMLLYWGFGPLEIDASTYRFGQVPLVNFDDVEVVTLDRQEEPTSSELLAFDAIYGNDVDQVNLGQELVCNGNPENPDVNPGPWFEAATSQGVDSVTIAINFPVGLRKVKTTGKDAGKGFGANVEIQVDRSSDGVSWTQLSEFSCNEFVTRIVTRQNCVWDAGQEAQVCTTIEEDVTEPLAKKDAFTLTKTFTRDFDTQDRNYLKYIRVRRITGDNVDDNPDYQYYHQTVLHSVSFTANLKPAIDPPNCKIAKTAIKIRASEQLSGNVEGFNAVVQTIALTWNGTIWTEAPTSNPASLMIYVLMHPANPKRKQLSNIDFDKMKYWYEYCEDKGFEYNSVLGQQRGLLDVLRDICAAGRASPALKDGKWTVTIDEEKNVEQHFTPHNSWGFEGTKALPDIPHGLRVKYYDQDQEFQESEIIVYNTGYDESNASLFESISLPGVTKKDLVIDHARWHFAQVKLRPEIYNLNADTEYLVCNRGDRVKVMHDVPMWGLASGRVKSVVSDTVLILDEVVPMQATKSYTIRIRAEDGSSHAVNCVPYGLTYGTQSTALFVDDDLDLYIEQRTYPDGSCSGFGDAFQWLTSSKGTGSRPVITTGVGQGPMGLLSDADRVQFNRGEGSADSDQSNLYTILPKTEDEAYAVEFWMKSNTSSTYTLKVELNKVGTGPSAIIAVTPEWQRFALYLGGPEAYPWRVLRIRVDGDTSATADIRVWGSAFSVGEELPTNVPGATVVLTDGWYNEIQLSAPITAATIKAGDLFMFGENQQEAQDLIVTSIEPSENGTARLTLMDYGVTDTYNIFEDYLTLTEDVVFETQITLSPVIARRAFGQKKPTITGMLSDESVLTVVGVGAYISNILVSFVNAEDLPAGTAYVEAEYDLDAAVDTYNTRVVQSDYKQSSVVITDVVDGELYKIRLRYVANDGRTGLWTDWSTHRVVGRSNQPPVFDFADVDVKEDGTRLYSFGYYEGNQPPDWRGAEIRYTQSTLVTNWDEMRQLQDVPSFYTSSPFELNAPQKGSWRFAFRSLDYSGNLSAPYFVDVVLGNRRSGAIFAEFSESSISAFWTGTKNCLLPFNEVSPSDETLGGNYLIASCGYSWDDTTTWDETTAWYTPATSASYITPVRDLGKKMAVQISKTVVVKGSYEVLVRYSDDNVTWSAWEETDGLFSSRYFQLKIEIEANDRFPLAELHVLDYSFYANLSKEDLLDVDVSSLSAPARIGIGDVRAPIAGSYAYIQKIIAAIQDTTAGSWTVQIIDKDISGWRFQFRLNGVLADPALVDFYVEGVQL